jgi:DNA-3-methyladenine glycosylase
MAAALEPDFYERPVLEVARALIGCTVRHGEAAGLIVETEAYHDSEPACHAFVGLTPRTSTLFGPPGRAYVYRSYGIHAMLNAVCEPPGVGAAVLIRALQPTAGIELMRARRGLSGRARAGDERELCSGPGKLTQALGVTLAHNGARLDTGPIQIFARAGGMGEPEVLASPRVGITKAVELPWRFSLEGCAYVSRPHPWPRPQRTASAAGGDAAGR